MHLILHVKRNGIEIKALRKSRLLTDTRNMVLQISIITVHAKLCCQRHCIWMEYRAEKRDWEGHTCGSGQWPLLRGRGQPGRTRRGFHGSVRLYFLKRKKLMWRGKHCECWAVSTWAFLITLPTSRVFLRFHNKHGYYCAWKITS